MKRMACSARLRFSPSFWLNLRSSAMTSSARVSLLVAALAVGGISATPAHALTATAQPALLNQEQGVAKSVEDVGYRRYYGGYHRPYRNYGRPYHRRYYGGYYRRPYYPSYGYGYGGG